MRVLRLPGALWKSVAPPRLTAGGYDGGTGLGFDLPANKVFDSSAAEFANGLSAAYAALTPSTKEGFLDSNPQLAMAVDAMTIAIQAVTGAEAGQPIGVQIAQGVADVLAMLTDPSTQIGSAVSAAATAAMGSGAQAIPILGQLIVGYITAAIEMSGPAVSEANKLAMDQKQARYCNAMATPSVFGKMRGTGPGGDVGPADLVSQGDVRIRIIEWLAGAGSRDANVRSRYDQWLKDSKKLAPPSFKYVTVKGAASKYGITGIPQPVAREIVALLEGIYAARRNPDASLNQPIVGDNGAALFPVLMQILLDQYRAGAWNQNSVRDLADTFVAPQRQFCVPAGGNKAGAACADLGPCSRKRIGLDLGGQVFWDFIGGWRATLEDPTKQQKAKHVVANTPKLSALELSPALSQAFVEKVNQAELAQEQKASRARATRIGLISTGVLLLGGGAFWGARKLAKKR